MFPVTLETLLAKHYLSICFVWLHLWYFMWGKGTERNAEYPAVAFFLCWRFALASIFLGWLSTLCLLPTYLTCASAVPAWKRKCTLTPVPSASKQPELGSLFSLINSCFLCVLPHFVSFLSYFTTFSHVHFLWRYWHWQSTECEYNE